MLQNLMIVNLHTNMSEDEIEECMKDMAPVCWTAKTGFFVCMAGYDNDKRELWQIPEIASFFKILVRKGFISFLEVSSSAKGVTRLGEQDGTPGFGALEVWMIANGMMGNGRTDIEKSEMLAFFDVLDKANATSEVIVGKGGITAPKRKGFQKSYNLCDGQQKFKGMPKWNTK